MTIIDLYCTEVGKHLPRKNRADIEAEIRATLEDMVNDRSRESGKPIDDAMVTAALKEYGAPAKVAATYKPEQVLIGPRLYPAFELVLKIVVMVMFGVALAGLAFSMIGRSVVSDLADAPLRFAPALLPALTSAFGTVVLVFAILERIMPVAAFELHDEDWDPASLARRPNPDRVKQVELVTIAVFTAIGLIILNLYPNAIGFGYLADGKWTFIPVLSGAFLRYLLWINALGLVQIAFNLFMLRRPTWKAGTRVANLVIQAASLLLVYAMLSGPDLVAIAPEAVSGTPLAGASNLLVIAISLSISLGLVIAFVVTTIEMCVGVYRLLTRTTLPALPARK